MNRMFKTGVAATAFAAAFSVFAQAEQAAPADAAAGAPAAGEVESVDEGAVGWTPIAIGLASPVQLPWGHCEWDVRGIDIGALYYGAPKMYGVGIAGLGQYSCDTAAGLQVAGFMNWNAKTSYGLRASAGANLSTADSDFEGVDVSLFAYRRDMWGVDIQGLGVMQRNNNGVEISGLFNYTAKRTYGFQASACANLAETAYGCQLSAIFNWAGELHGSQIALVNFCEDCQWGFQIGLINIILSNKLKVLPIVNAYF